MNSLESSQIDYPSNPDWVLIYLYKYNVFWLSFQVFHSFAYTSENICDFQDSDLVGLGCVHQVIMQSFICWKSEAKRS